MSLIFLRERGRSFHARGAATANARSPYVVIIHLGCTNNVCLDECRLRCVGCFKISSHKYSGANPRIARNVSTMTLYCIQRGVQVINLAALFCTSWSFARQRRSDATNVPKPQMTHLTNLFNMIRHGQHFINHDANVACRRCRSYGSFSNPNRLSGDLGRYQKYVFCFIIIHSEDHPGPDLGDTGLNLQACCLLVFQIVNPECDVDLRVISIQLIRHSMTTEIAPMATVY